MKATCFKETSGQAELAFLDINQSDFAKINRIGGFHLSEKMQISFVVFGAPLSDFSTLQEKTKGKTFWLEIAVMGIDTITEILFWRRVCFGAIEKEKCF